MGLRVWRQPAITVHVSHPAVALNLLALAVAIAVGGDAVVVLVAVAGVTISVAVHECAHALTAGTAGYAVDGVRVGLRGGTTAYTGPEPPPATRLAIAVAGPLANAAAATFLAGAALAAVEALHLVLVALAAFNLWLVAVNLVPLPGSDGILAAAALHRLARGPGQGRRGGDQPAP